MSILDKKEIEYVESMKHLLGCVCKDGGNYKFIITSMKQVEDSLWDCFNSHDKSYCALEDLTFFDEDGNVIGDYNAYTFKYYGYKID